MLLIHVGLPKAGSTSLQTVLFRSIQPSHRVCVDDPATRHLRPDTPSELLLRAASSPDSSVVDFGGLERLRSIARSASETLVVSIEGLSIPQLRVSRQRGERLSEESVSIAARLYGVLATLSADEELTRVVCQIRRPDEWLASAFAWGIPYSIGNSLNMYSRSFEGFVSQWLSASGRIEDVLANEWLDETLSSVVGNDKVTFLPLHTLGTMGYWKAFTSETTLRPDRLLDDYLKDVSPKNVRIGEDGTYRPPRPRRLRQKLSDSLPLGSIPQRFVVSKWNVPARTLSLVSRPRPRPFRLEAEVSNRIRRHYGPGNKAFAATRGLDLDGQGYW